MLRGRGERESGAIDCLISLASPPFSSRHLQKMSFLDAVQRFYGLHKCVRRRREGGGHG